MQIFTSVIIVILLMGLGWLLRRAWLARQAAGDVSDPSAVALEAETGLATQLTNSVRQRIDGLRARFGNGAADEMIPQFREWAADAFGADPNIKHWLAALNDEQIRALTDHLALFCNDMGFELGWLTNRKVSHNAALQEGLSQIVRLYSRASFEAVKLQEEVEIFRVYHDYMQNPQSRANRELGEHLFGKLLEEGTRSVSISEYLASSTRRRQQQIVETIRHSAVEDPKAFHVALKAVLFERVQAQVNGSAPATNGTAKVQTGS